MPITKQALLQSKREERLLSNTLDNNNAAEFGAGVFDTAVLTAIFSMFTTEATTTFLNVTGRFFLFPFAALANVLRTIAAWRQVYLEKFTKTDSIVKAVVETLVTIAITFAVVASLVATAVFGGLISPVIFTVTLGLKSIFQIGSAGFYFGKAMLSTDPVLREGHLAAAKDNAIAALSTLLATTAILLVFVLGKSVMAPFGIAAGIVGVGLTVHGVYRALNHKDDKFNKEFNSDDELTDELDASSERTPGNQFAHSKGQRLHKGETGLLDDDTFNTRHLNSRPAMTTQPNGSSSSATMMYSLNTQAASTPSPTGSDSESLGATRSFSNPHSQTASKATAGSAPSLVSLARAANRKGSTSLPPLPPLPVAAKEEILTPTTVVEGPPSPIRRNLV